MSVLAAELVESVAHCFVESLDVPVLADEDGHHVFRVLRTRDGELVTCTDGRGKWRACRAEAGRVTPSGPIHDGAAPLPIGIGFALPKGERPELIVQHLTEVGVARIVPLSSDRTVVRWDGAKARAQIERWRRVARQAAMQSRRCTVPEIAALTKFDDAVMNAGVALAVPGGSATPAVADGAQTITILVGPEGGWSARELELAATHGADLLGLGSTVLRVETACLAAALLCAPR